MKILIYSPLFHPSVGGVETVTQLLAQYLTQAGQEVKVVCQTAAVEETTFPFEVIRNPSPLELLKLTHWCQVYFQGCVSLKGLWPLLFVPRPLVVTHHTWYRRTDGSLSIRDRAKRWVTYFATNIAISSAIAQNIPAPSTIIPNPYDDRNFYEIPNPSGRRRDRELVFLGRLVSDKGADLLIEALYHLKQKGLTPELTIIGTGPEKTHLKQQVKQLKLNSQVNFIGVKVGSELTQILNSHQILVVPSRWQEPFGLVALEGIACGCVVVGSEGGGLKDCIGPCGVTFPNNNSGALTEVLFELLQNSQNLKNYRTDARDHLTKHQPTAVIQSYLHAIESSVL